MIGGVSDDGRITIAQDRIGNYGARERKGDLIQRVIIRLVDETGADFGGGITFYSDDGQERAIDRGVVSDVERARRIIAHFSRYEGEWLRGEYE